VTTPAEALQLLLEAIEGHAASSGGGWASATDRYVKLDWIAPELEECRASLADRESSVRASAHALYEFALGHNAPPFDDLAPVAQGHWDDRARKILDAQLAAA
jgi:hypothetical protein